MKLWILITLLVSFIAVAINSEMHHLYGLTILSGILAIGTFLFFCVELATTDL